MTTERHSPEWLINNSDRGIAFEVACASALTRLLAENAELQKQLEAIGAGGVGQLIPATVQHQRNHNNDNDLQRKTGHLISSSSSVPAGWKLVPVEPTREMLDAARKDLVRDAEIDPMLKGIHSAILDAAPQPPVIEQKAKPACEQDEAIYRSIAANYTQQPPDPAYLLRDLADDISVDAVDLIAAIRDAGLGNYSINMKLPTRVCVAMCQRFSDAPQPQGEQEPVGEVGSMPGTTGFTMACFHASDAPVGTKLYTRPQPRREPLENEQARRIYNSATYSASLAVFMTRVDAEHPDADDKGVSGWLQEAEDRVKHRITEAAHEIGQAAAPQQGEQEPVFWYRPVGEDGGYEGPIHNAAIEPVRKLSGAWIPLVPRQQPPDPAYLLRDLADDISVDALDLIAAIRDAGLGDYSINMKLPTRVCVAMCQKFSDAQQPQGEQEPVAVVDFTTEGWRKIVDALRTLPDGAQLYTRPQPAQEPLTDEAKAVIDAARAAMDESTESYNGRGDISIASELAASLSLCLDEYDLAIERAHGIGQEAAPQPPKNEPAPGEVR